MSLRTVGGEDLWSSEGSPDPQCTCPPHLLSTRSPWRARPRRASASFLLACSAVRTAEPGALQSRDDWPSLFLWEPSAPRDRNSLQDGGAPAGGATEPRHDGVVHIHRVRGQRSGLRGQGSEGRGQKAGLRGQGSEVRAQRAGVRAQRTGVRGQGSEVRGQGSG
ncbi:hypothetical protein EYF80_066572 [Liparis tanakae]|uniref:Uncharacterized protein n=1 Tax=Liparis tanakae TaxID=230148 RepID=A0A4Z2E3K9_9TELE|nr:hypothetical protein EYF80_066572 [Liparis tanakae]